MPIVACVAMKYNEMSLDMNTNSEYGHEDWGAAGFRRLCIYAEINFFLF